MTRWDGTVVVTGETISLPARGTAESDVCANDGANTLGVVSVQPQTANSTVATIVRIGANNRYRFPTAVR